MNSHLRLTTKVWEGIFAADFTLGRVRERCMRLAQALVANDMSCIVAFDTRFMSNLIAHDIYYRMLNQGVSVNMVPTPAPLPALQRTLNQQQIDSGLIVSARNRPYWYNGLVLLEPASASLLPGPDEISADSTSTIPDFLPFPAPADGGPTGQVLAADAALDVRKPYLDMLRGLVDLNLIRRATLTVFADPMHGTVSGYLPAIIGDGGQTKAIEINRETDPLFGKFTPLPAEASLARIRKLVRESDSNIGLAFSADGTALGVVDKYGEQLQQLEIALVLASYLVNQHRQRGIVIAPMPTAGSRLAGAASNAAAWEAQLGFKVELVSNPSERIASQLAQDEPNLLLGCTRSGELILGNVSPYPDALMAGLLFVELLARTGGSLSATLDDIRARLAASE